MKEQMVVSSPSAHLRLLISVIHKKKLAEFVQPETLGVTFGDLSDLVGIITPGVNLWWSTIPRYVEEKCKPEILRQHPELGKIKLAGITNENFDKWLNEQIDKFGKYLHLKTPPTRHRKAQKKEK